MRLPERGSKRIYVVVRPYKVAIEARRSRRGVSAVLVTRSQKLAEELAEAFGSHIVTDRNGMYRVPVTLPAEAYLQRLAEEVYTLLHRVHAARKRVATLAVA